MLMLLKQRIISIAAGTVLGSLMLTTGCAVHAGYYYDPYDHRYYAPTEEDTYILRWENETHRRHEDFRHRRDNERQEYWNWRRQHGGDRHHDRDRHHHRDQHHDRDHDHDRY